MLKSTQITPILKNFRTFVPKLTNYCEMNLNVLELSEQEIIRRNSLNELRAMGIDPYPAAEYASCARWA